MVSNQTFSHSRLKPIAAGLAGILGLASPAAFATVFVTNCHDSGAGSLRSAVASARSGEVLDATSLDGVCSRITLTTGAIIVTQADLTIIASGMDDLSISAHDYYQYNSRIFYHVGTGTLDLQDLTVTGGYLTTSPVKGGCIYSKGSVSLENARVTACIAKNVSANGVASGGGIFAKGSLTMKQSTLSFNYAVGGPSSGYGRAGGSFSNGFRAYYSTVADNSATNAGATNGQYGGIFSSGEGAVYLYNSTVAKNKSLGNIGGLAVSNLNADVKFVNSTISSNSARGYIGGAFLSVGTLHVINSTVTANFSEKRRPSAAAGLVVGGLTDGSSTFEMQSSIIANNSYGSSPAIDYDLVSNPLISGSNNLVQVSNASLPQDTIVGRCAFLGSLKDNGGLTLTHKPLGHSPAIDAGNNTFGVNFDQRGELPVNGEANYPRVLGPPGTSNPRADIGAYEVNRADEIYDADFDSC
jgi:hypothetical protein